MKRRCAHDDGAHHRRQLGIGAGTAKSFAADGHLVIACGRDASRTALQQLSPNISVRLFDMTDRDACRRALTGCFADLIILCAGTCEYLDHGQVDAASWSG